MLSWIFRNRRRLRVIYGVAPAPTLAGPRFGSVEAATAALEQGGKPRPGEVRVLSRHVVIRPMPPRIAS
jgi:hypothetical protein